VQRREKGKLDIFANAGVAKFAALGTITEQLYDWTFNINVKGLLFTVQKALPLLPDGASIILNASIVASKGLPINSVYSATKAAIRSFARTWTTDLKERRILVNAVSPGSIDTPGLSGLLASSETGGEGKPGFQGMGTLMGSADDHKNAVRLINPRPIEEFAPTSFNSSGETQTVEWAELAAVLDLGPFERFVFVMSVLEHYSEHECSILLGCSRQDVIAARIRALQQLGNAMEFHAKRQVNVNVGSEKAGLDDNCRSVLEDLLHI
jgi:hypothetical protein